ncbi:MAG: type II/IV secretion system ATPase subunit, partial [Halobaculum sp.]
LLPGDEELLAACKDRLWERSTGEIVDDRRTYVAERARRFLSRRLTTRNTRAWLETTRHRVRRALAAHGLAVPPVDSRFAPDRLDDLVYYVLRDVVGEGVLTIPLRDDQLEDVEANRVGERVKVVPRSDVTSERVGRVPTNVAFDDEAAFVNVVTSLAARDGTELNAATPSAKVNVELPEVEGTVRCAVALPVVSEDGPHLSVRKQAPETLTPVELIERDAISPELVAALWLLYEHDGVVLFSGPTGTGKTTLLNAHTPFVPFDDRPISIDEGSREVELPHETGVSLTTRDHEQAYKRVSMADLMTEANYLNPDVEVIAEINTPASFETFGETLNTGHGVLGTTHAEDPETLVNRVIEQGLPAYLLGEIDLVVFPRQIDGERYVSRAVELAADPAAFDDCAGPGGVIRKDDSRVAWNRVAARENGEFQFAYDHPELGDATHAVNHRLFDAVADRTDRTREAVEREFRRKRRYVEYLRREGVTEFRETFEFLADLRTDEPATLERVRAGNAVRAGGDDD